MKKRIWDLYAPIYKRAMKADQKIYDYMYTRIPEVIRDKEVLELASLMPCSSRRSGIIMR